jgi:hypothetical protein
MIRTATEPFQFFTVAHVTRIGNHKANTVRELLRGLENCSDESIYHHMVPALGSEEFLDGSTANDFAKWLQTAANCGGLSEQLAALDERYYTSIEEMRNDLCAVVGSYIATYPDCADEPASAPFQFCEGLELSVPLNLAARTLQEFRTSIQTMTNESFYLHFVASTSRLKMQSNDFSMWLSENLGLDVLAKKIEEIDRMDCTLEAAREKILQLIDEEPISRENQSND